MTRRPSFPRLPLFGIFALIVFAIGAAYFGRVTHAGVYAPAATQVAGRDLLFYDRADGAVLVVDPADHHTIDVLTGQQGFLRGTMRAFARTRRLDELGPDHPFHLARWSDGRLTIDDPATQQHIELLAFGPTNAAVFAPLLEMNR